MKKIYALGFSILFTTFAWAQQPQPATDAGSQQIFDYASSLVDRSEWLQENSLRGSQACTDTNRWSWARSFNGGAPSFFTQKMENDTFGFASGWATYFDVPAGGSMDVSGFRMYARSIRADMAPVNVTCAIYAAGADSLPTGAPLATTTVSVAPYTGTTIDGFENDALFANAVNTSADFCLVMEVPGTAGDSIEILRGFTGSGAPDFPSSFQVPLISTTQWLPGGLLGNFGARIAHVYPFVEFTANNSITTSVDSLCTENEMVTVDGMEPEWVTNDYWSIDGFVGQSSSYWSLNGGSTFGANATADSMHTFADPTVDYTIQRHDSILTWFNGICLVTEQTVLEGAAAYTNSSVPNLASGVDAFEACNNGPGATTIYNESGQNVFYADSLIACTPNTVPAGFYSNGVDWWEFDANGVLQTSGQCSTNSVNEVNAGTFRVFMRNTDLIIELSEARPDVSSLNVFDLSGRHVTARQLNTNATGIIETIDMSEQPAGMYFIRIDEETFRVVK